ncbi:endoribonuclease SymE [Photorhabdus laumondii subsp. clarkei]|uniref:Endoribonuclease SymE n=1 Tax=Photorhabdus laumondii subsp. clarkei TaxID=2029685 RepID=A0A329VA81_9GAMM|nr:endoribonuclease SymE [Photorhabdus laumondii subsp. clarkei]
MYGDTNRSGARPAQPAIHLKGQWLKQAGFNTGGQITVKVMDGCLVLIPDSEATQQQHQQYQRQQAQLREIKQQMQALITGFVG